jgi:transmembrane sensor
MTLDGEALFRVRHDAQRPFRVRAGRAVTEDLGTEFTVRAYANSDSVRVVVQSGSVSLKAVSDSTRAVVRPGQMATLSSAGGPIVSAARNVDALMAFSRGQLVFDNAPMQRVADELARWYDVDVKLASPALGGRHVTVTFSGESIDEVLRTIALSVGARVEHTGRNVTFTSITNP